MKMCQFQVCRLFRFNQLSGPGWLNELGSWITYNLYKPITNTAWVCARLCKLQNGCTRFTAASDKVCQLLAQGRWFSPGTPVSSTTKTGRNDIAEILLKVALNTKIQIQIHHIFSKTYIHSRRSVRVSWNGYNPTVKKHASGQPIFSKKGLKISKG